MKNTESWYVIKFFAFIGALLFVGATLATLGIAWVQWLAAGLGIK